TLLEELTKVKPETETQAPHDVHIENEISAKVLTSIDTTNELGNPTVFTCPDCGGVLFEHGQDAILKFKCHTGHSYTIRDLLKKQTEETEDSLWYAIRSLEQRRSLLETLAERYSKTGNQFMAKDYERRKEEIMRHIDNLKRIIVDNMDEPSDG
ncbi:MAG TPA: hypothetical protein VD794_06820, partial [Flavisolibacter sp.]|nr:hypothetical protein [Flavisolibacter sp.]